MSVPARSSLLLLLVLAACLPTAAAQQPGEQHRRTLPEAERAKKDDERVFKNWIRLLRAGSPRDRVTQRERMLSMGRRFLPQLRSTLLRRNHFDQRQVLLVLMELNAEETFLELEAMVSGKQRGAADWAALALGKLQLPAAEDSIEKLVDKGARVHRPAACLALGLVGGPRGANILKKVLSRTTSDQDEAAILLGMGMGGWASCHEDLAPYLTVKKDRLRRAATAALGLLQTPQSSVDLVGRLKDEDPLVRRFALEGLARGSPGPETMDLIVGLRLLRDTNTDVLQRAVLLLGRIGGPEAEARLEVLARHRAPEIRAAAVAASLSIQTPRALEMAKRGAADPHRKVRRVAFVVMTARAFRQGRPASLLLGAADSDEVMRAASLLGHVYLQGSSARKGLIALMTRKHKKDVRELAGRLVALLDRYPPAARKYARARLQTMLDDAGVAASWNLNRSLTLLVRQVLRVENARPRGGAGAAPGGGTAADRQATRRVPAHAEDLYLHLEAWPLFDKRPRTEMPPVGE